MPQRLRLRRGSRIQVILRIREIFFSSPGSARAADFFSRIDSEPEAEADSEAEPDSEADSDSEPDSEADSEAEAERASRTPYLDCKAPTNRGAGAGTRPPSRTPLLKALLREEAQSSRRRRAAARRIAKREPERARGSAPKAR